METQNLPNVLDSSPVEQELKPAYASSFVVLTGSTTAQARVVILSHFGSYPILDCLNQNLEKEELLDDNP